DTGVKDDPKIITWIQESEKPQVNYEERPGKWVVDHAWPSANVAEKQFWLHDTKLVEAANVEETITVSGVQEHGLYAGVYCPFGEPGDLPSDQRLENGKSVTFTSDPLKEDLDLLGHPVFDLEFISDQENALVAVRLCDKAPTGESTLISWGMLNLNHLKSHENPEALVPGKKYQTSVKLDSIGQTIPKGHQLEVAIAPTYWPQAWPSPQPVTLKVIAGDQTKLKLPVRTPQPETDRLIHFDSPEVAEVIERDIIRDENRTRQ